MKKLSVYFILIMAGLLSACQDDEEFKIPTDVAFQMDMNRNASTNGRLSFSQGYFTLAEFSFDGRREEGGDVFFSKDYEGGLHVGFEPATPVEALTFQIPQGNYYRIEVELDTYHDVKDEGLVVMGSYLSSSGVEYPLRFQLGSSFAFKIEAREPSGNKEIVLKAGTPATGVFKIDPVSWFAAVPDSYLDNATLLVEDGETEGEQALGSSYILISEDINEDIYRLVLGSMAQSVQLIIN